MMACSIRPAQGNGMRYAPAERLYTADPQLPPYSELVQIVA